MYSVTIQIKIRYAFIGAIIGCLITAGVLFGIYKMLPSHYTIEVYKYISTDNQSYRSIEPVYKFNIGDYSYYPFEDWAIRIK